MARTVLTTGAGSLPLRAAVRVDATFTDGTVSRGSGYMVGANDVLTASHIIYSEGKTLASVVVYPEIVSASTGYVSVNGTTFNFNEVGDGSDFISSADIAIDYAIIGLEENVGYSTGWYDISSDFSVGDAVYSIDYGSDHNSLQAVYTEGTIETRILNVVSHTMEKVTGSSGSPIIRTSDNAILGVHSANGSGGEYFAAGFSSVSIARIEAWIAENNVTSSLLPDDAVVRARELATEEGTNVTPTSDGPVELFGLAGDDTITGSDQSDILFGGDGDDTVMGGAGDDFLGGDNTFFTPYVGTDLIDGGEGTDTALYLNNRDIYELTWAEDGSISVSGFDTLVSIERIQFADSTVRVDLDQTTGGQVYRLYQAMFNRAPDENGLVFWNDAMGEDVSLESIASGFITSSEFTTLYGEGTSDSAFVDALYQNVLGRSADAGGEAFWTDVLSNGTARETVLIGFSESAENINQTADSIANGFVIL